MIDYEKISRNIGNRFDAILIASERMKEIKREVRIRAENGLNTPEQTMKLGNTTTVALREIEEGKIGLEYLDKLNRRVDRSLRRRKD
jgi:DNA-directed RNA polymerase subunit K/omega